MASNNAWEAPSGRFSLDADVAIEPHRFVKVNASGNAEYASSSSEPIVGVSYAECLTIGAPVSIAGSGIVMVEVSSSTSIGAGEYITCTSDGMAATTTSYQDARGIALTSASPSSTPVEPGESPRGALVTVLLK